MPLVPSDPVRRRLQTVYQPLTHHLRHVLESAGKSLKVNINVLSLEHMLHTGRNVSERLYWTRFSTERGGSATDCHSDAYYFPLYEDLLRMAWPFTTGPWQTTIRTSMDEVFEEKVQPILKSCDENAALDRYVMEFKPYSLASGCSWVLKGGRRFVGKLYTQGEGGVCWDIDGVEYNSEERIAVFPSIR
ncbi:hypothetical protein TWF718_010636 [Orbilia javanica]|uniref:Uncharacterized protein n=1 Tax=Orbilia javanica TaxID=47235 RepID=A0AAN8MST0_9PEZI